MIYETNKDQESYVSKLADSSDDIFWGEEGFESLGENRETRWWGESRIIFNLYSENEPGKL
jgi:hypothetical protein